MEYANNLDLLAVLGFITAVFYFWLIQHRQIATAAPAAIMALGIFILAILPQFPAVTLIAPLATLELLVIWGLIAVNYINHLVKNGRYYFHNTTAKNEF